MLTENPNTFPLFACRKQLDVIFEAVNVLENAYENFNSLDLQALSVLPENVTDELGNEIVQTEAILRSSCDEMKAVTLAAIDAHENLYFQSQEL